MGEVKEEKDRDVDSKVKEEVKKEEPDQEDKDVQKIKAYGCIFFNVGDPYTHVLEYRRWKACMRNNAVLNHAPEIMMSILERPRKPNEGKMFQPWNRDDNTETLYISATDDEYRTILGKLMK